MEPGLGAVVLAAAVIGTIVYSQADAFTVFQWLTKALLLFGFLTFCIQCFGVRLANVFSWVYQRRRKTEDDADICALNEENLREKEKVSRNKIQSEHSEKVASYKERIFDPREENKKKRKEDEYYRFLGPAWKGEGHALGGEVGQYNEDGSFREAAQIRQIPENINEEASKRAREELERRKRKTKKTIELPDEPPEGHDESVVVVLRTPIGQMKQRRFWQTNTLENVLDFMTALGFHKKHYTVCTSYPRQCLSVQRERTLKDLGLSRKVTLNIEEKEED